MGWDAYVFVSGGLGRLAAAVFTGDSNKGQSAGQLDTSCSGGGGYRTEVEVLQNRTEGV